jgi:polysaccharide biosynthesis/export protein
MQITTPKKANNILVILVGIFSFLLLPLHAQDSEKLDQLLDTLSQNETGSALESEVFSSGDKGYKSFVQNELQNIFTQLDALTQQDKADITFAEVNKKRIDLATALCSRDQRACFLIDEYRSYKSFEQIPQSSEELKLFGLEIFSGYANDFNFYDSLAIGQDYIIKIGDQINISLFGGFSFTETLEVDANGSILIKGIGEYQVAGLSYADASMKMKQDISQKYVGTEVVISLDQIRSKQIFVLGNVKTPGTYALNSFGTALNALIASGGVNSNSSLRSIQVIHKDNIIKSIDLYDLLMNGEVSSVDYVLSDGDSLLVRGLSSSVSILGEVIRPAIYEVSSDQTLEDVLGFALGSTPFADLGNISIERVLPSGEKTILNPKSISSFLVQNGDSITIHSSQGQKINSISIEGSIRNAGEYAIEGNNTLGDIIKVQRDLLDDTYIGFAVLKRLNFQSKSYRLLSFSLNDQLSLDAFNLYSGDKVYIFSRKDIEYSQSDEVHNYLKQTQVSKNDLMGDASQLALLMSSQPSISEGDLILKQNNLSNSMNSCLRPLDVLAQNPISNLMEAKLKIFPGSGPQKCTKIFKENSDLLPIVLINSIPVTGNVRFPGLYPTSPNLNADDLFNLAGGVLVSKLNSNPEFDVGIRGRGFGNFQYSELADLTNLTMLNLKLDRNSVPGGYIRLVGEFNNPGIFPISRNMNLSEVYNRAGGLTLRAFPLGGILTRESIESAEKEALQRSKAELSEILASAVASGYLKQNSTDLIGLISLMTNMSNTDGMGRLVTELNPARINSSPELDVPVEDGDTIYMPSINNTVTIVGQVLNPVTVPHEVGASFQDYLKLAGGLKKEADKGKIYAILPNGISMRQKRGIKLPVLPFMPFERSDILPGSTIIIPRKARPLDSIALVETVTPILANLSVTAASIAAISDR